MSGHIQNILTELRRVPILDGETHPAEELMRDHLYRWGSVILADFVLDKDRASQTRSDVLVILARVGSVHCDMRRLLVIRSLREDVTLRYAAVIAAELWGDLAFASILRAHVEPVAWLHNYAQQVAEGIEAKS